MHRYKIYFLIICLILMVCIVYQMNNKTTTTMKYFPIDEANLIKDANTTLEHSSEQEGTIWAVQSSSNKPVYLRQDVSLIYENGVFKGMQSKWKTEETLLYQEQVIPTTNNVLLQSISFHHGEIHHEENKITSMQKMTDATLHLIYSKNNIQSFGKPTTEQEKVWHDKLADKTRQQLKSHLDMLLQYHDLSSNDYVIFPLYKLAEYSNSPLPGSKYELTDKAIGQFWEGLYNNYVTLLMSYKQEIPAHYTPFVLVAKDASHLMVLFELEKENYKLIQQLDTSSSVHISSIPN